MRAWTYTNRGVPSDVLKLHHDFPQPQTSDLKPNEALIKVSYTSLFWAQASLMAVFPHFNDNPWIPGMEFSGTIVGLGDDIEHDKEIIVGQEVFGMLDPKRHGKKYNGSLAEYMIAPRDSFTAKPRGISLADVSGLGAGGCTAIGFAERAGLLKVDGDAGSYRITNLAEGKKILVTGGSTGIGAIMLQFAKALVGPEGTVVTTCSPRKMKAVRSYDAADEIIDYTQYPKLNEYLAEHHSSEPFDAIIDIPGSDPLLYRRSPAYLKPTGVFVFGGNMSVTHQPPKPGIFGAFLWLLTTISLVLGWQLETIRSVVLGGTRRRVLFHSGQPIPRNQELLLQLIDEGKIKGAVDSVWKMDDVLGAFEYLSKGLNCGKVVIDVAD